MFNRLKPWLRFFLSILYPEVCEICGQSLVNGESVLCTACNAAMPRTYNHRKGSMSPIHRRLFNHTPIEQAASLFDYVKQSPYARLIHLMKYNNRPDIGVKLGQMFAHELDDDHFFDDITMLVPIPVHYTRLIKRGYNQTEKVAEGISDVTSIPVVNALKAVKSHSTQTAFSAYERWKNVAGIYDISNPDLLANQHIALIDDVITTGSTMVTCCEAIHQAAPTAKISVISLGATKSD
ncbi:MAG: ComF family protein [Muribaculaceae bacterium]|nr:ComF family protein [Muribaculaceae bacterium]